MVEPYDDMPAAGFLRTETGEDIPCRTKGTEQHLIFLAQYRHAVHDAEAHGEGGQHAGQHHRLQTDGQGDARRQPV